MTPEEIEESRQGWVRGYEAKEAEIERLRSASNALLAALENDDDPSGPAEELRVLIGRDG